MPQTGPILPSCCPFLKKGIIPQVKSYLRPGIKKKKAFLFA
jgi:hypothetical protein